MAILPIIVAPDPRLKRRARPVAAVDDAVRRLIDDMLETMYAAPGIGLAAPQVGVLERVIVVDAAPRDAPPAPLAMVNPRVVAVGDDTAVYEEGCLSLPRQYADVERPARAADRLSRPHRGGARNRRRGAAGDVRPARDRPPRRGPLRRSDLAPQALDHPAQARQDEAERARRPGRRLTRRAV